jgi:TolB-like protein
VVVVAAAAAVGMFLILAAWAWLWRSDSSRIEATGTARISTAHAGSIAVLPLANISRDARQKYFSDGLTDEMIAALARVPGLRVAARSSSFAFAGKNTDIRAAAKALNVRSILEGSVRQDGDRVRIEIELVNGVDGFQQWSRSYDRDLKNILGIQDEIAQSVARILTPARSGNPRLAERSARIDPAVYRKYLQAQVAFATRTEPGTAEAAALLREVTHAAPDFPDAFAAQASTLATAVSQRTADPEATKTFQAALNRALTLDPANPQALAVQIEYESSRLNWDRVIADARILRRLYPHNSTALDGLYSAYRALGLYDLALSAERESARLDPLSYIARRKLGYILVQYGHYGEAIDALKSSLEVQPGQPSAMSELCFAYAFARRIAQAKSIEAQLSLPGMPLKERTYCAMGIALSTRDTAKSRAIAEEIAAHYGEPGAQEQDLGKVFAAVGEYDRAVGWFERAYDRQMYFFDVYSEVGIPKALFKNPRWIALAQRPAFRQWRASSARARKLFPVVKS